MLQWQAGGLDLLTLDSLYNEGMYRASQRPVYGAAAPNPFEASDPFAMSNTVPMHAAAAQMAAIPQNHNNPFQSVYLQTQQHQHLLMGQQNPFGDTGFEAFPAAYHQTTNPFGSSGLL